MRLRLRHLMKLTLTTTDTDGRRQERLIAIQAKGYRTECSESQTDFKNEQEKGFLGVVLSMQSMIR
jgi:hypothetical protein